MLEKSGFNLVLFIAYRIIGKIQRNTIRKLRKSNNEYEKYSQKKKILYFDWSIYSTKVVYKNYFFQNNFSKTYDLRMMHLSILYHDCIFYY